MRLPIDSYRAAMYVNNSGGGAACRPRPSATRRLVAPTRAKLKVFRGLHHVFGQLRNSAVLQRLPLFVSIVMKVEVK